MDAGTDRLAIGHSARNHTVRRDPCDGRRLGTPPTVTRYLSTARAQKAPPADQFS
jgi:hypothetical protein